MGPQEFSRQSRQLKAVKTLTSTFLCPSRQLGVAKTLVAVQLQLARRQGVADAAGSVPAV
jgi:hypothetical protein